MKIRPASALALVAGFVLTPCVNADQGCARRCSPSVVTVTRTTSNRFLRPAQQCNARTYTRGTSGCTPSGCGECSPCGGDRFWARVGPTSIGLDPGRPISGEGLRHLERQRIEWGRCHGLTGGVRTFTNGGASCEDGAGEARIIQPKAIFRVPDEMPRGSVPRLEVRADEGWAIDAVL